MKNFSYTYSSHESEKINLFKSCLNQGLDLQEQINHLDNKILDEELQESIEVESTGDIQLDEIISENVSIPITECQAFIKRAEAPFLPLTMTTYRTIAYKKFKSLMIESLRAGKKIELDVVSSQFCQKVDRELLDK